MKANIITIGDEILIGQVVDTNSAWLATELTALGFEVTGILTISDNEVSIKEAVDSAMSVSDLVILTGGLGPTNDDITKYTLCSIFDSELEFNNEVFEDVKDFLKTRGVEMNKLNKNQALFPKSAYLLNNKQGTAPGMWFEKDASVVVSLPGVPWEMKGIFQQQFIEKAKSFFRLPNIYYQTVMITGISESALAEKISDWETKLSNQIKLAYLPSPGIIRLRLGIIGDKTDDLKSVLQKNIDDLHKIIPEHIYSDTEISLQRKIGEFLIEKGMTLSTAESCTGGTIASLITGVPGSSNYFKGSVVAYSNDIKIEILNVDKELIDKYGAVSKEVVESMAIGVGNKFKTDYSIATSGIAGPDGGTDDKPVGTVWIAVGTPKGVVSKKFVFGKEREFNIKRSSVAGLNFLLKNIN
jgi:nicotinamide-nucleotide amidase